MAGGAAYTTPHVEPRHLHAFSAQMAIFAFAYTSTTDAETGPNATYEHLIYQEDSRETRYHFREVKKTVLKLDLLFPFFLHIIYFRRLK